MASRMERYYRAKDGVKKRSQLNQNLYREIYDIGEYSNIEGIAEIDKNNEIDITKVKKMLKNREDYNNQKEYRKLLYKPVEKEINDSEFLINEEPKNYDIRDVLKEAKNNNEDHKDYLKLDNTNYDILKNLKIKDEEKNNNDEDPEELKEMINTITSTSMLNKMGDKELSLKLLEDLDEKTSTKNLLNDTKDYENTKTENTFFTSSMSFDKSDFDDGTIHKKKANIPKIIMAILLFLIVVVGIVLIFNIMK